MYSHAHTDNSSSRRYKTNIRGLTPEEAAAIIFALRPVWYMPKVDEGNAAAQGLYGLIAEEVAEVDSTLVYWVPDEETPGAERPEAVHYMQLGPLLVQVAQAQKARIAQLEARAEAAEARMAVLEAEMRELRGMVAALATQPARA